VDDVVARSSTTSIDPRIFMSHTKASEHVDNDEQRDAIIKMLTMGDDDASDKEVKIVSVVGSGGLGKTSLAKVVYDMLTVDMKIECKAFPVGQKSDLKKVLTDILLDLDDEYKSKTNFTILDERQLIKEIQAFLRKKEVPTSFP
jgi:ABC-type cobalamin/Fe3+-siderophores transport system ATPase subunit